MAEWANNEVVGETTDNNSKWANNPVVDDTQPYTQSTPKKDTLDKENIKQQQISIDRIKEHPYMNAILGIPDAALSIGSGMLSSAWGGLKGIATVGNDMVHGKSFDEATSHAADVVTQTQDARTYQPRTDIGKGLVYIAGVPIQVGSDIMSQGGRAVGDALGIKNGGLIGESVGEALPATLATLYGGRSPITSVATTPFQKPSIYNVPIVGKVAEGLRDVNRARSPEGVDLLAKEGLQKMTTYEESQKIINGLDRRSGEMVPGSPVTSADAIARANREQSLKGTPDRFGGQFVALQDGLSKIPETSSQLNSIKLAQEQARKNVLNEGSGTDFKYGALEDVRKGAAQATYPSYGKTLIEGNAELSSLMKTPAITKAITIAEDIAANEQKPFKIGKDIPQYELPSVSGAPNTVIPAQYAQYPLSNLQHIKMALDKMVSNPKDYGIEAVDVGAAAKVRGQLVNWIEKKSPAYEASNAQYAIDSMPINQMDLWRVFRAKLEAPTGKETPGSLLKSLQEETKTLKQASDFRGNTSFSDIFDTKNSTLAARLAAEVEMDLVKKRMAGEVNVPGVGKMGQNLEPQIPNLLWRPSMVANFLLKHLAKDVNQEVNTTAANILADPKMLSGVLKQIKKPQREAVLRSIRDTAADTAIVGSATSEEQAKHQPMEITITGGQKQ